MSTDRYLEVEVGPDAVDLLSGVLWGAGVVAVEELAGGGGAALLRTALPDTADDEGWEALVEAVRSAVPTARCRVVGLVDDSWLDTWRRHARPWPAGRRLVVHPAWLPLPAVGDHAGPGRRTVLVDPGRAFGSGGHTSTRLALAAVDAVLERRPPGEPAVDVLDVGCGSGVLAVAALLLGAARARAVDVDPEAVRATADNAARNGVADRLVVDDAPLAAVPGRYDLVVANLLAPVLRSLGPDLGRHVAPDGHLVLAGLLAHQVDDVVDAVARSAHTSFEEAARVEEDGWVGLTLSACG